MKAVAALGIPTTRSLALLTLPLHDLPVVRENGPEPTSLTARLAPSFIRIGHFEALNPGASARNFHQIFLGGGWKNETEDSDGPLGGQGNLEGLRDLTEWCKTVIGYKGDTAGWVKEVIKRNAEMVGGWQVSRVWSKLIPGLRLDAWGAQYRQYQCAWLDHRLWTLCLYGYLGRRAYLQPL